MDSYPSGSHGKDEIDIQSQADLITADLLNSILQDFLGDAHVKMEVEDDIDEDEFEDKWPYTLDKKEPEEPPKPLTPVMNQDV